MSEPNELPPDVALAVEQTPYPPMMHDELVNDGVYIGVYAERQEYDPTLMRFVTAFRQKVAGLERDGQRVAIGAAFTLQRIIQDQHVTNAEIRAVITGLYAEITTAYPTVIPWQERHLGASNGACLVRPGELYSQEN